MPRIALGVEYCGEHFFGFQTQASQLNTIQAALETALSRIADEPITILCAGRTDRGVHATGQVIHFDTKAIRPLTAWREGAMTYLPKSISVRFAFLVDDAFHARFSALSRSYCYVIHNDPIKRALLHNRVTWHHTLLNEALMQQGASYLLGEHDFTSFRAADCQSRSPMRAVTSLTIHRKDAFIFCEITANAFLHHMVRNIIGTLIQVGEEKKPPAWVKTVLEAKNRVAAGARASANGLYLINVLYPKPYLFPPGSAPFMI